MMEVINLPRGLNGNPSTDHVDPELECEMCSKTYQRRTFILSLPLFIMYLVISSIVFFESLLIHS